MQRHNKNNPLLRCVTLLMLLWSRRNFSSYLLRGMVAKQRNWYYGIVYLIENRIIAHLFYLLMATGIHSLIDPVKYMAISPKLMLIVKSQNPTQDPALLTLPFNYRTFECTQPSISPSHQDHNAICHHCTLAC